MNLEIEDDNQLNMIIGFHQYINNNIFISSDYGLKLLVNLVSLPQIINF